jgi:hypothetical protein
MIKISVYHEYIEQFTNLTKGLGIGIKKIVSLEYGWELYSVSENDSNLIAISAPDGMYHKDSNSGDSMLYCDQSTINFILGDTVESDPFDDNQYKWKWYDAYD